MSEHPDQTELFAEKKSEQHPNADRRATRQEALDEALIRLRTAERRLKEFEERYHDGNMFTGATEIKKELQDRVEKLQLIVEQLEKIGK